MWLVACLKNLVSEHLTTVNMLNSLKTCTAALLWYCFITLTKIELENIRLSVSEILGVFVYILTADDMYFLCNKKNLRQPIQLKLWKKQKIDLIVLLHLWSLNQVLNILKKKMTLTGYVFSKLDTAKDVVS